MARGGNATKLPKKISFFKADVSKRAYSLGNKDDRYYGPYMTKPTARFKNVDGEFIEFLLDKDGNYIRQKKKDE